jgi:uncharacterized membrane protein
MTLEPLLDAPPAVQAHVATVVLALAAGTWLVFFSRKGSRSHRAFGVVFLVSMGLTALVSLFIHRRMPDSPVFGLSPTHLLVLLSAFTIWRALDGVRSGDIKQHRRWVHGLYFGALIVNGLANVFLFGGITHDVFLGP